MNSDKIPLQAESPFMNGLNPTAEFNDGLLGSTDGSSTFLKANMASKKSIASRRSRVSRVSMPNPVKDTRSIALSIFNMMNLVIGGGVIGLPYVASNFGYVGFLIAIGSVFVVALTTQYFILSAARELESLDPSIIPGYEELGYLATGQRRWGKLAVSSIVMFHTFTCCCAYSFVIKKEIGPIIARLMNLFREMNDQIDLGALRSGTLCGYWYLDETFLVGIFILCIITPLACLRNVKYLGWTSMIAIVSILFFVATVISQTETAASQCPIAYPASCEHCPSSKQVCAAEGGFKPWNWSPESIYALPTLLFSFECHGTMLPIYCDLRRPSTSKMLKIIFTSLFLVVSLYTITALFGYASFFNHTSSEFLLMFEYIDFDSQGKRILILLAKLMMVLVVTFSAPLFCFVLRKSVLLNLYPDDDPEFVDGKIHYGFTIFVMACVYAIVASVNDLKIFFAMGGQISATNLMIVFPSVFYIFIVHKKRKVQPKTIVAWILLVFGIFNQTVGTAFIVHGEWTAESHNQTFVPAVKNCTV